MKKIFLMALTAACVFSGCRNEMEQPATEGTLSLEVQQSSEDFNVVTKANDNVDDFVIEIVRPKDNWSVEYRFGEIKGDMITLGSGNYTITAHSPAFADAAWDLPHYSATQNFTINAGEVTPISLVCELTNVKVTIVLSEGFKQELSTYDVVVSNGKGKLTWQKNASVNDFASEKAGYFSVAPLEVIVNGHRSIDNTAASTTMTIANVVAKNHHIINIDAKVTGQLGGDSDEDGVPDKGIIITVDPTVNKKDENVFVDGLEEIPVDGGEDGEDEGDDDEGEVTPPVVDPKLPYVEWPGNKNASILDPVLIDNSLDADMKICAPYGIKEFMVIVESDKLNPIVAELIKVSEEDGKVVMDMINNPAAVTNLGRLGLPTGDALKDKTSPIDFILTRLVTLIPDLADPGESFHYFTLYLKDSQDNVLEQRLTFKVVK